MHLNTSKSIIDETIMISKKDSSTFPSIGYSPIFVGDLLANDWFNDKAEIISDKMNLDNEIGKVLAWYKAYEILESQ